MVAAAVLAGCGDDGEDCPGCADAIGVPTAPVCADELCTAGVSCAQTVVARTQAELEAGAGQPGACVALAPGAYGDVTLAAGTSLLGRWADEVRVGTVVIAAGAGATVRGVTATSVVVEGASALRVDQVRAAGGARGIDIQPGSAVTIVQTEVTGTAGHAIVATDPGSVALDRVFVHDVAGPGVWLQGPSCEAGPRAPVSLDRVHIERAQAVGVSLLGAEATLGATTIVATRQGGTAADGHGLAVADCSSIDARGVVIDGADAFGAVMFQSAGRLGAPGEAESIIIINGRTGGLWLEGDQGVTLENFDISASGGVGVGIGAETVGIIIINGRVGGTTTMALPVVGGGQEDVGDGLMWRTGAQVSIDGLTLEASGRNAALIDGAVGAGSSIANVSLGGGDESKGILQQGFGEGTTAPEVGDNAPPLTQEPDAPYDVPESPAAPVRE
jgi:hypothetical protein